jgi:UDP-N-acetylmuramyl tripeptide synthase
MKDFFKKITPNFLLNYYHWFLSMLGAFLYRFPSKKIRVIGVVGTDGKTTTTNLITAILEEVGYRVASISTIWFKIGTKKWKNTLKMTMPGRFYLQRFLKESVNAGCQYAVLEVTDEGIKQHRHRFIDFKIVVLTNITPEHIEAHGSFEKMRQENEKLFQIAKEMHIINIDDENKDYFLKYSAKKKYTYGLYRGDINSKNTHLKLQFPGEFNLYNAMAAICVGLSEKVDLETCKKALEKVEVIPGRMETIIQKPFKVIVDYAHTVVALEKVYQTLKPENKKMICVFGATGGGRDRWKRSEFGKIASKYCDIIILTNEDPYDENPNQILSEIRSGIFKSQFSISNLFEILDRREAIKKALELAQPNDVIIITGKGREPWICVAGGKKIPWDDGRIAKEEFKKLNI